MFLYLFPALLMMSVVYITAITYQSHLRNRFKKSGIATYARIVNRSEVYGFGISRTIRLLRPTMYMKGTTTYIIYFKFNVKFSGENVKEFSGSQRVDKNKYEKLAIGDEIRIIYLPTNPRYCTISTKSKNI